MEKEINLIRTAKKEDSKRRQKSYNQKKHIKKYKN